MSLASTHLVLMREDTLDLYMELLPQSMAVVLNERGAVVRGNDRFFALTGYSELGVIGLPAGELFRPDEEADGGDMAGMNAQADSKAVRLHVLTASGTSLEADTMVIDILTEQSGRLQLYLMTPCREQGDPALLRYFAAAFLRDESLGILLLDGAYRLVDASPLACRILGVPREELLGRPVVEGFTKLPDEHLKVVEFLGNETPVHNHPFTWKDHISQEKHALLMDVHRLADGDGRLLGAYILFKDVSNLRSLEEQVQRSDRLKMIGQIAAGTAHEIRNPLTAIKGFLQMMKKTLLDRGLERESGYADIMLSEIHRINNLVNEFLLLSKPKDTMNDLFDPVEVLNELMPIVASEANLYGTQLWYSPGAGLGRIVGDRELLKQVLLNICKNGLEAMGSGGHLAVNCMKSGDDARELVIEIRDTGPGIPEALLDRIFDPFVTTKETGTGLGLSVCQRIVHDFGGRIGVSSRPGSTAFTVCLPTAEPGRSAGPDSVEDPPERQGIS